MSQLVIRNPSEKRSFKQVKCIYAISLALGYAKEKATALSAKPKTKGQASAMIKTLQKLQSTS